MKKIILWGLLVLVLAGGAGGYWFYTVYYVSNVELKGKSEAYLFVRTGSTMEDLVGELVSEELIKDRKSFEEIAKLKKFTVVKPGRYHIKNGMSNRELVNMFRSGAQEPVTYTLTGVRTKDQIVSRVCKKLEADSAALEFILNDNTALSAYGFNNKNILTMFIPNTYEMYWNTSAEQFMERMAKEYKAFWTDERKQKARDAGLSQSEVVILASIVQSEQNVYNDEKRIIAGLYINRLRKGIPMQSDPTLIYALGDFTIRRVLNSDKEIDSPYNTYKHTGLPPGPIILPEISSVDAVLNYDKNKYIYMCAVYGTGKHKFTDNLSEHNRNADAFRNALSKANIKR